MNATLARRIERAYKYVAAPGAPFTDAEANEVVGPSLEAIRDAGNPVTPDTIVEFSTPEDSPMHKFFEWDDTKAAVNYRKSQARVIVGRLMVIISTTEGPKTVKSEFNFVTREDHDEPSSRQYFSFSTIQDDPLLKMRLYETALREFRSLLKKYESVGLSQLDPILEAIKNVAK